MKFGLNAPNFGKTFGKPHLAVEMIEEAEKAGWDGFFLWDHLFPDDSAAIVDPFVALAAAAVKTKKILLGTTVTPVPRRRPWKLASECVTLDHLSNGRVVLGMGLGIPHELKLMNEETNPKIQARMVTEQLEILNGLWSGEDFSFEGEFYKLDKVKMLPKPVQQPRIKLWGAGTWPNKGPFKRAVNLDGIVPLQAGFEKPLSLEELKQIVEYLKLQGEISDSYDIVRFYFNMGEDVQLELDKLGQYRDIGVTWWLDSVTDWTGDTDTIREIIRKGPPNY